MEMEMSVCERRVYVWIMGNIHMRNVFTKLQSNESSDCGASLSYSFLSHSDISMK